MERLLAIAAPVARRTHRVIDLLRPDEIRTYIIHLTQERRLAASSIIVAVSALRFFFTVTLKRPRIVEDDIPAGRQVPVVLSQEEVAREAGTDAAETASPVTPVTHDSRLPPDKCPHVKRKNRSTEGIQKGTSPC